MRRLRIDGDGVALCVGDHSRASRSASATGPALVLLHGYAESSSSWRQVCEHLVVGRRVLALDLRGHGRSAWARDGDYSLAATARDLARVCEQLQLESYVVAGHSTGGMTALAHASARPAGLVGLALVDVDPFRFKDGLARLLPHRGRRTPGSRADFVREWLEAHPRADAATVRRHLEPLLRRTPAGRWTWRLDPRLRPRAAVVPEDPMTRAQVGQMLGGVRVPTLLLRGARSAAVSRIDLETSARRIAAAARVREIAGAGHALLADAPARVALELDRFLAEIARATGRGSGASRSR